MGAYPSLPNIMTSPCCASQMINPNSLPIYDTLLSALKSDNFFPAGGTLAYGCAQIFACMQ